MFAHMQQNFSNMFCRKNHRDFREFELKLIKVLRQHDGMGIALVIVSLIGLLSILSCGFPGSVKVVLVGADDAAHIYFSGIGALAVV